MKTKILMAVLLTGVVMTAGAASAQRSPDGMMERPDFATLDTDGDGSLTMAELEARGADRFAETDTDGDGALSAAELVARATLNAEDRVARMITRMDTNEDGVLQMDEMQPRGGARFEQVFERMDTDQDGVLSEAEFDAAQAHMQGRMGNRDDRGHGHGNRDNH